MNMSRITGSTYAHTAPSPYPLSQRQPSINSFVLPPLGVGLGFQGQPQGLGQGYGQGQGQVARSASAGASAGVRQNGVGGGVQQGVIRSNTGSGSGNGNGVVPATYPPYPNLPQAGSSNTGTGYNAAPVNFGPEHFASSSPSPDISTESTEYHQGPLGSGSGSGYMGTPMPSTPNSSRALLSNSNTTSSMPTSIPASGSGVGSMTGVGSGVGGKSSGFVLEHGYINDMGHIQRMSGMFSFFLFVFSFLHGWF